MADDKLNNVVLLLGSNIGDKVRYLHEAMGWIEKEMGTLQKKSSLYKTDAWGKTNQDFFINCAVSLKTNLSAKEILNQIHGIENIMGRKRSVKWEPRIIDIDILFFNNEIIKTPTLEIPHPEFNNRMFAIIPVKEIMPLLIHPVNGIKIDDILAACTDRGNVSVYKN